MALRVEVRLTVGTADDGSPIVDVYRHDLTFNARPEAIEDEVPLALAALRDDVESALAVIERRLTDWTTAIRVQIEKTAEQQRRHLDGD